MRPLRATGPAPPCALKKSSTGPHGAALTSPTQAAATPAMAARPTMCSRRRVKAGVNTAWGSTCRHGGGGRGVLFDFHTLRGGGGEHRLGLNLQAWG